MNDGHGNIKIWYSSDFNNNECDHAHRTYEAATACARRRLAWARSKNGGRITSTVLAAWFENDPDSCVKRHAGI